MRKGGGGGGGGEEREGEGTKERGRWWENGTREWMALCGCRCCGCGY